jgi:hypothetical protein
MTRDFDLVRGAYASSLIGRSLSAFDTRVGAAWTRSLVVRTARQLGDRLAPGAIASTIRTFAVAGAIAAIAQLWLITVMPATVAPAMPKAVFVLVAVIAIAIAWQAEAVVRAWPGSRLARWMRR